MEKTEKTIPTWQMADEFMPLIVDSLRLGLKLRLDGFNSQAKECYFDVFRNINGIIEEVQPKLYGELNVLKDTIEECENAMNKSLLTQASQQEKARKAAESEEKMMKALNLFHQKLLNAAFKCNILVPQKKDDRRSGAEKFKDSYIKEQFKEGL